VGWVLCGILSVKIWLFRLFKIPSHVKHASPLCVGNAPCQFSFAVTFAVINPVRKVIHARRRHLLGATGWSCFSWRTFSREVRLAPTSWTKSYAWWWITITQQDRECPPQSMQYGQSIRVRSRAFLLSRFLSLLSQDTVETNAIWRGNHLLGSVINTGRSAISCCCTVSEVHVSHIIPTETMYNCYSRNQIHNRLR